MRATRADHWNVNHVHQALNLLKARRQLDAMSEHRRKMEALSTFIRHVEKETRNAPILLPASDAAKRFDRALETFLAEAIDTAIAARASTTTVVLKDSVATTKALELLRASGYKTRNRPGYDGTHVVVQIIE